MTLKNLFSNAVETNKHIAQSFELLQRSLELPPFLYCCVHIFATLLSLFLVGLKGTSFLRVFGALVFVARSVVEGGLRGHVSAIGCRADQSQISFGNLQGVALDAPTFAFQVFFVPSTK